MVAYVYKNVGGSAHVCVFIFTAEKGVLCNIY